MADCHNCGKPAQHEAGGVSVFPDPRWVAYCCTCFDHDWLQQRLLDGQQCGKMLVTVQQETVRRWEWRKDG